MREDTSDQAEAPTEQSRTFDSSRIDETKRQGKKKEMDSAVESVQYARRSRERTSVL